MFHPASASWRKDLQRLLIVLDIDPIRTLGCSRSGQSGASEVVFVRMRMSPDTASAASVSRVFGRSFMFDEDES